MTLDEMKEEAKNRVEEQFPDGSNFSVKKVYENLMDGTLVSVEFQKPDSKGESTAHVHFGSDETRFYRWHNDVLSAVANHKERSTFFRLLSLSGIGGVIALVLVVVFSVLLCVLAFTGTPANPSIVEVVKLSFTIILGFFFGSQTGHKKQ
jgi:hypothetical protein